MMVNNFYRLGLVIIGIMLMMSCDAAIVRHGKVIGVHSGRFMSEDGYLRMNYRFNIDQVWPACEKTVVELKGDDVEKTKKISKGTIKALIQDEKVTITVEYVSKELTTVSILVGLTGNNIASQLIHEKIGMNLRDMSSTGQKMTKPETQSPPEKAVKQDEVKTTESQAAVSVPEAPSSSESLLKTDEIRPSGKSTIKTEDIR